MGGSHGGFPGAPLKSVAVVTNGTPCSGSLQPLFSPVSNNYGLLCYLRACFRAPTLPSLQARGRYRCGAEESCRKMGSLRFFGLVFVAGAAVAFFSPSNRVAIAAGYASTVPAKGGGVMTIITNNNLKDDSFDIRAMRNGRELAGANVEDYSRFDPVPSSKAAIKS
ncbi:hypothetical protein OPV22_033513 [Ensete ventricosum]|uniref:Uncharacterized protein n=1 Tax=Ensete ventricosum TaxID=4639 RepID=A0AAV8PZP6_ENSVE|nr:hypothetical protein OPV22_033513 [Ensete ventricosum]